MTEVTVEYEVSFGRRASRNDRSSSHIGERTSGSSSTGGTPPPSRIARLLALAHYIDQAVDSGLLKDHATAARLLGMTRARIAQVMALLSLSPSIQERILTGELQLSEPTLRPLSKLPAWTDQEAALSEILEQP
jgi:hypothetical protein